MNLKRNMTEALDLPKEVMLDLPLISMMGKEEITIENHKGILAYHEEIVRIATKVGTFKINGKDLKIKHLSADALVVAGSIAGVEFLS